MPFLTHLAEQHERFVARYPVPPPEPEGFPTFIPDPLAPPTTLRGRIGAAVMLLQTALWLLLADEVRAWRWRR